MKITNLEQFKALAKDGMEIKCDIDDTSIEGKITIEENNIFICQDEMDGVTCKDKKGYEYSWRIIYDDDFKLLDNIELSEEEEENIIFTPGEQVGVSDKSEEDALENLKTDDDKYYYIGKTREGKFVTEINNRIYVTIWKYICKIPKEEESCEALPLSNEEIRKLRELIK